MRPILKFIFIISFGSAIFTWIFISYVSTSKREAILIEDRYKGIDPEKIIYPAKARFLLKRIIPEHITLHRIQLFPKYIQVYFKKGLKQSEILGLDEVFYIRAKLKFYYELKPENLTYLFASLGKPNWKQLNPYLNLRLQDFLKKKISTFYQNDENLPTLKAQLQSYFDKSILDDLNEVFVAQGIHFKSVVALYIYVPQLNTYRAIINASSKIIQQKLERIRIIDLAKAQQDVDKIKNESYFTRMEKTAKLLEKYPHLQNYLAIDRLSPKVKVMMVPYQNWLPSQNNLFPTEKNSKQNKEDKPSNDSSFDKVLESLPFTKSEENTENSQFSDLSPP